MKTLREVISNPSSTHRIPLPLAAAVSLMIAIAPAHAQDGQLQPADEIVNEQPLDQNPELIGEEDIAAEQMTDPATLDEPLQTPDILVDPTIAADPEALLPDEGQAAADGATDLLPAEGEQAVTGGELLPPADVEPASADELLAAAADGDNAEPEFETVTIDPNEPKSPAVLPEGVVRIIIQNRSLAPLDVFMDSQDGADPVWVMTLNPGFQATQPSNTGQAWLLAQQDQWKGGFEAGQEPVQRLRFDGGPL